MNAPRATYRLQFRREFGFAEAAAIAPYLSRLGVSHVYASPYLRARPGSTHGYDIVAHDELNAELGEAAAFQAMHQAFAANRLAQILDFVPNHMGVGGADNPLWLDVLEWGPDSPYAGWFDIDWEPAALYLTEKLLVPVLGDQYGVVLEEGKLELKFDAEAGGFAVWAYDTHKLPVCPLHYAQVLGSQDPDLERLGDAFGALPEWRPQVKRRAEELKRELATIVATQPAAAACVAARLGRFNAAHGGGAEGARPELDALIQRQYWRASHFRVAGDDINYRRFFNINDLAGLRVELPDVFEHVHRLAVRLLRTGVIEGLRIDHIDGLLDPRQYLERLRAVSLDSPGSTDRFYLVVEKILADDEHLPVDWEVQGTTGYEFANQVLRLLTDARGEAALTSLWQEFSGERATFDESVRDSKIFIMKNEMASELNVLARDAARVARQNSRTADFTRRILHRALRATVACFPVYRTYLDARGVLSEPDHRRILAALSGARRLERDLDPSVFDFLELLLTGALVASPRSGFSRHAALRCAMKFQQFSGPVMAKGLEDTAFYRYNRLISHNEVGGDPRVLGCTVERFHEVNRHRPPAGMLGTSTHDTKRGEDVRMRLATLAEIPDQWSQRVRRWHQLLGARARVLDDAGLEYFFYQTLLGSFPVSPDPSLSEYQERLRAAMIKAAREARRRTSWARPNQTYEAHLMALIDSALSSPPFMDDFRPFQQNVARAGAENSLVQTVLKLTLPGVPDLYQGTELWDLSLVDPDNRRPVDYVKRATLLEDLLTRWERNPAGTVREVAACWPDGRIKLLLTAILLRLRSATDVIATGEYLPCEIEGGEGSSGAFLRRTPKAAVLVIFRRFPFARRAGGAQASLRVDVPPPPGAWRDAFRLTKVVDCCELSGDAELPIGVYYSGAV